MKNISLYIHIPFCIKKCNYCDFLSASCTEETRQKYVQALCREMSDKALVYKDRLVDTVFFGGGTPSVLSEKEITEIMNKIKENFKLMQEAEITMEVNPKTITKEKLATYQRLGINRLSVGLQSANDEELKRLGRIHTWEDFLESWNMIREAGFHNVNIDIMSALPEQTCRSYEGTLEKVLKLRPEHISAYSLIIEEGTLFYQWYGPESNGKEKLPSEDTEREMYQMTEEFLKKHGYERYEISNYALPGYECKHNIGYWKRKEYLGLGLGAASLLEKEYKEAGKTETGKKKMLRASNLTSLEEYLYSNKSWEEEITNLSTKDAMEEFMFLGLRMMEGISGEEFENTFGISLDEVYGKQIKKLMEQGLLEYHQKNKRIALTKYGIDVSNYVFVEFIN